MDQNKQEVVTCIPTNMSAQEFYQEGVIPHPQPQVGWGCKPNIELIQN